MLKAKQTWKICSIAPRLCHARSIGMKPGTRASVHGVRAPIPDLIKEDEGAHHHRKDEKGADGDQTLRDAAKEVKAQTHEEEIDKHDLTTPENKSKTGVISDSEVTHRLEVEGKSLKGGKYLRREELPSTNPNFQQKRHFSASERDYEGDKLGKAVKSWGNSDDTEDLDENKNKRGGLGGRGTGTVPTPEGTGVTEKMEERAAESLYDVRRGVPSEGAGGVMTDTNGYYYEDGLFTFSEERRARETADDALAMAQARWEEARTCGGHNEASRVLHARLRERQRQQH